MLMSSYKARTGAKLFASMGYSQAVRQWFLVPPSLVRIQVPQPSSRIMIVQT